jgi:hypothetical protein
MVYCGLHRRDLQFTMVYTSSRGGFVKRFAIGGAIMNRDYSCVPEEGKIRFLTDKPVKELRLKYRHTKGARIEEQIFRPEEYALRTPRARGYQLTKRTVSSVSAK